MASEFMKTFDGMALSYDEAEIAQRLAAAAYGSTWDQFVNRAAIADANAITAVMRQHGYNPSRGDVLRAAFAGLPVGDPMLEQLASS